MGATLSNDSRSDIRSDQRKLKEYYILGNKKTKK